jgi:hypothetical protein
MTGNIFKTILLLGVLVINSCKPEVASWHNESVFPLAQTQLSFRSIVADSLLEEDGQGLLNLFYEYSLYDFRFDTLLTGIDTIADYAYSIPFTITLPPGAQVISSTEVSRLGLKDIYLSTLHISEGYLKIQTTNKYTQPIRIEYSVPDATINGIPFVISREIPPAQSATQPYQYHELIKVENMQWNFFSTGSNVYNCYNTIFKVWISPDATEPIQINQNDQFGFFMGFDEIDIAYARGWFGQHDYQFEEETGFGLFRDIEADEISLEDVELTLEVTNHIGVDLRLRLTEFSGTNAHNNQTAQYSGPYFNVPINITRAPELGPGMGIGQVVTRIFDFAVNSNLIDFLENMPANINLNMLLQINPLGNISGGNDHYYGTPLEAKLVFRLPLHLSAQNLRFSDTTNFSGSFLDKPIYSFIIKTVVNNTFPFTFDLQMNFLDSNLTTLCTLPFDIPVQAAQLMPDGKTAGPAQTIIHYQVSNQQLELIRQATGISFSSSVTTMPYGQNVKIFNDYCIDIKTFAILNMLFNQEE